MRLDEFRKQYPQYDGIPDENLAKALHEKYYSQIPFDRFSNIIGLAAPMAEEDVGTLRRVGDIGVGITQAMYGGVKALTDLFGANNPLSQAIGNPKSYCLKHYLLKPKAIFSVCRRSPTRQKTRAPLTNWLPALRRLEPHPLKRCPRLLVRPFPLLPAVRWLILRR
jgi:hypothetical protein